MDKLFTVPLYLAMTRVELEMARKSPELAVCPDGFPLAWTAMLLPVQRALPARVNGNIRGEQGVLSWGAHKQTLTLTCSPIVCFRGPGGPLASPISQNSSLTSPDLTSHCPGSPLNDDVWG